MKASIARKNKFCLQVQPIKSSVSLDLERKSLSICPKHIQQSTQLNVSAPLIFYDLEFSFNIYIIISIILCSPLHPHPHHSPYKLSMAWWTWLNRIKQLEGKKIPKSKYLQVCTKKKSQRTNKCKGIMHFRKSQGCRSLQARRVFGGHVVAQRFPCCHPPSLR